MCIYIYIAALVESIASLAPISRRHKNIESPIYGPLTHYGSMAHPQDQIWPAVAATKGRVLLIRHLSSFGTFRASYDASIWPPVGTADVLRRNGVLAPIPRLAEAQSASPSLSRLFSLRWFAHSRSSSTEPRLLRWLTYEFCFTRLLINE